MVHYLLLKFESDYMSDELFAFTCDTFQGLRSELGCIRDVQVYRNCVARGTNADLLVVLELTGREGLDTYLGHPIHQHFAQVTQPHLTQRTTFDRP